MPSKSKQQQKFMGIVRAIQKGKAPAGKFSKAAQKAAKSMKKSSVRKYAKTKHDDLPKKVKEEKKRDYKAEYKKFQSSTKMKKYRAELNKYNRKKGTYGNGDGKDASHKGGKIVGFESQSKNRGRAEKSRLKKEGVITENPAAIAAGVRAAMARAKEKELSAGGGKKVKVSTALANKSHPKHKQAKGIIQRIKDKAKSMLAKSKKKKAEPKKQSKGDANFYARQFGGKVESINENDKVKVLKHLIKRGDNPKDAKKDVQKLYNKVSKMYKNASPSKKAEIISALSAKMESVNEIRKFHPKKPGDDYMGGYNTPKGDTEMFADKKGRYYIWVKPKGKKERYIDLPKNIKRGKADDLHRKLQKTMGESVNESKNLDKIKDIVKRKQHKRIGGVIVDMQTANAILKVHKALNPANRKKYEKLSVSKMADIAYKLMK